MYVRNRREYENRNVLFYGLIGEQLTLLKQIHIPICFTDLTIPLLAGFCMSEIEENIKTTISNFMVLFGTNFTLKARIHAYNLYLFALKTLKYNF